MKIFLRNTGISFLLLFPQVFLFSLDVLTLEEAIQRAWSYSPATAIANDEVELRKTDEYQAGLRPNPVANVTIDGANSIGRGRRHCEDRETTYSLSQVFELGGKRSARRKEAAFETCLSMYAREATKLDLRRDVISAFIDVYVAQEYVKLAEEQLHVAELVLGSTAEKVDGGKLSLLQKKKAELHRVKASIQLEKARRTLTLSKKKLALLWGGCEPDFIEVNYPLYTIEAPQDLSLLISKQADGLEMKKWEARFSLAYAYWHSQRTRRIPDVVVTAGYVNGDGDDGLLLGVSLPIPVFDRNQAGVARASQELQQLYEKKREDQLKTKMNLEEAYDQLLTAYKEGRTYEETILPSAKVAFESAKEEYLQGKSDYLDLLDTQRTLFDTQEQYLDILTDYHQAQADVQRLIGK